MTQQDHYTIPDKSGRRQLELFGPTKGSDEEVFWHRVNELKDLGITRSAAGLLAKLNNGNFTAGLRQLERAATARVPAAYLWRIISNLENMQNATPRHDEPAFVQEWRRDGFEVIKRRDGTYKIAGDIYDREGHLIGF